MLLCGLAATPVLAQKALTFEDPVWDFGRIEEKDGKVSHTFIFTNNSDSPLLIERVNVDCGCTVPKFSREPILPGAQGTIEITFDPANYSGKVSKATTIYSNGGKNRIMLKITGEVVPRPRTTEDKYPFPITQGLRSSSIHEGFGNISNGETQSMAVYIINTSDKTATIGYVVDASSGYLQVDVQDKINPGEEAVITFTYDLSSDREIYGTLYDKIYLTINDRKSSVGISANAMATDNFSDTDISKAPKIHISEEFINFGEIAIGSTASKDVKIYNKGKMPLTIRSISSRRGTTTGLQEGTVILPGKKICVSVSMTPKSEYGTAYGGVTLVTNDPDNPVAEIRCVAEAHD